MKICVAVTAEVALAAATAKTVLQLIAATNHGIKLLEWGVFFDGTTVTNDPVLVELLRQTDAGTMTSLTPQERTATGDTIDSSAQHTATVEPSGTTCIARRQVHPQSGYQEKFAMGREIMIGAGARLGCRCTAPDAVNVIAEFVFEE